MKKKDAFSRWKEKKLSTKIITGIGVVILLYVAPLLVFAVAGSLLARIPFAEIFGKIWLYGLWGASAIGVTFYLLFEYRTLGSRRVKKVNVDLEDSHFMSLREMSRNAGFTVTKFSELGTVKDGIPIIIQREKHKADMDVVLHDPIHAMLLATTGTGKTVSYISPSIEVLCRTKSKPCIVVTDPKGELYRRHANSLKKNGYNVHVIDLRDTYHSTLWNPFNDVWRKTDEMTMRVEQIKGKYYLNGIEYLTREDAEDARRQRAIKLKDEIYVDIQDLINTMCPVDSGESKSWQQGARDLLVGLALRFWEDVRDGYMPREKYNLYNLWWNLTEYAKGECDVLKKYIDEIADDFSRAGGMANTVLVSQDRTLSSYLGSVNQYLHWMADGGIAQLTSGNEIEFMDWDESPNALFIKVPDDKDNRHTLVSLMLMQLYKALVEKATRNELMHKTNDRELLRACYFLMDEFGNLPKIPKLENTITIARSCRIYLVPVLQSLVQLENVYGKTPGEQIRDNCNIRIFMGTNDEQTRHVISEACGKKKAKQISYNEEKGMSVSTSAQSVPLIHESELGRLNDPKGGVIGNAVVLVSGNYPIIGRTTPVFKAQDIFCLEESSEPQNDFMEFDEKSNRYDIALTVWFEEEMQRLEDEGDEAENFTAAVQEEVIATEMQNFVIAKIQEKIKKSLDKLKEKISLEDCTRLAAADTRGKIMILDELADAVTAKGDRFLAAEIEKVRSFLIHSGEQIADLEASAQSSNYQGVGL